MPPPEEPVGRSSIHGADEVDLGSLKHPFADLAETPEEWRAVFSHALQFVRDFLATHDAFEVLSRSVYQVSNILAARQENPRWPLEPMKPWEIMEPSELEVLQALALKQTSPRKKIPASPGNMQKFLSEFPKCSHSFSLMQPRRYPDDPERDRLIWRIRGYTVYERNIFTKEDCEAVVTSLLRRIDDVAFKELGFTPSIMFATLYAIAGKIEERARAYHEQIRAAYEAKSEIEALKAIEFFCSISSIARRVWSLCGRRCKSLDDYRWAAFQISELCHSWSHSLGVDELRTTYGDEVVRFIEQLSMRPGELAGANPEHFFMNNPIWRRPFVRVSEATFYLPLPSLFYGFPFQIFERFLEGKPRLEAAYSEARASYLEDTIYSYVTSAMPSARIHRNVMWHDDNNGKDYENDVVALIGNTIFLFEAKSGKLAEAARRGGEASLLRNFEELFVEPGEQASRLETYLNTKGKEARLWSKDTGDVISLELDKPKVVHKFSICIEHFIGRTGAKQSLKLLGALKDDTRWAPVLALGELMLIWKHLDTEVSFFHYLTRRATIEDVVDFEGDEQDILSLYLTNGLFVEPEMIKGRTLRFLNFDNPVRAAKTPRKDRTEFEIFGVPLDHYWRMTLKEIYQSRDYRHRFDIIQVVLNQDPRALRGVSGHVRKWRNNQISVKDKDVLFIRHAIGKRTFVLGYYLRNRRMTEEEWILESRFIARQGALDLFEASDCAFVLRIKRSKEKNFDGFSFHRIVMASGDS
jgi:hypothetical protein